MSPLKCLAEAVLTHRPYYLAVSPGGAIVVACSSEGAVTVLSPDLRVLGTLALEAQVDGIAVGPNGEYLGFSLRDRTCVMTPRGEFVREAHHDPWPDCAGGGCTFSPDGRFFWSVRPGADERRIRVEVTRCDGWQVVATAEFGAEEDGNWTLVPHPEGEVVALWIGAGQDGQWLYWCWIDDGRLYVEEPALAWTGPPVFHTSGGEFLTDSLQDGLLRRHRFPDGREIGQVSEGLLFPHCDPEEEPEMLGACSQYVSDRRALVLSSNGRLRLLSLDAMRIEGDVALEGRPLRPHRFSGDKRASLYGDVGQVLILEGGRLLTAHRDWIDRPLNPEYRLGVWDASAIGESMLGPAGDRPYTRAFFSRFRR